MPPTAFATGSCPDRAPKWAPAPAGRRAPPNYSPTERAVVDRLALRDKGSSLDGALHSSLLGWTRAPSGNMDFRREVLERVTHVPFNRPPREDLLCGRRRKRAGKLELEFAVDERPVLGGFEAPRPAQPPPNRRATHQSEVPRWIEDDDFVAHLETLTGELDRGVKRGTGCAEQRRDAAHVEEERMPAGEALKALGKVERRFGGGLDELMIGGATSKSDRSGHLSRRNQARAQLQRSR